MTQRCIQAEIRRLQDAIGKLNKATLSKQVTHSSVVMDLQTKIGEMVFLALKKAFLFLSQHRPRKSML